MLKHAVRVALAVSTLRLSLLLASFEDNHGSQNHPIFVEDGNRDEERSDRGIYEYLREMGQTEEQIQQTHLSAKQETSEVGGGLEAFLQNRLATHIHYSTEDHSEDDKTTAEDQSQTQVKMSEELTQVESASQSGETELSGGLEAFLKEMPATEVITKQDAEIVRRQTQLFPVSAPPHPNCGAPKIDWELEYSEKIEVFPDLILHYESQDKIYVVDPKTKKRTLIEGDYRSIKPLSETELVALKQIKMRGKYNIEIVPFHLRSSDETRKITVEGMIPKEWSTHWNNHEPFVHFIQRRTNLIRIRLTDGKRDFTELNDGYSIRLHSPFVGQKNPHGYSLIDVRNPITTIPLYFGTEIRKVTFSPDFQHILAVPEDHTAPIFLVNLKSKKIHAITEGLTRYSPRFADWINDDYFMIQAWMSNPERRVRCMSDPFTDLPIESWGWGSRNKIRTLAKNRLQIGDRIVRLKWPPKKGETMVPLPQITDATKSLDSTIVKKEDSTLCSGFGRIKWAIESRSDYKVTPHLIIEKRKQDGQDAGLFSIDPISKRSLSFSAGYSRVIPLSKDEVLAVRSDGQSVDYLVSGFTKWSFIRNLETPLPWTVHRMNQQWFIHFIQDRTLIRINVYNNQKSLTEIERGFTVIEDTPFLVKTAVSGFVQFLDVRSLKLIKTDLRNMQIRGKHFSPDFRHLLIENKKESQAMVIDLNTLDVHFVDGFSDGRWMSNDLFTEFTIQENRIQSTLRCTSNPKHAIRDAIRQTTHPEDWSVGSVVDFANSQWLRPSHCLIPSILNIDGKIIMVEWLRDEEVPPEPDHTSLNSAIKGPIPDSNSNHKSEKVSEEVKQEHSVIRINFDPNQQRSQVKNQSPERYNGMAKITWIIPFKESIDVFSDLVIERDIFREHRFYAWNPRIHQKPIPFEGEYSSVKQLSESGLVAMEKGGESLHQWQMEEGTWWLDPGSITLEEGTFPDKWSVHWNNQDPFVHFIRDHKLIRVRLSDGKQYSQAIPEGYSISIRSPFLSKHTNEGLFLIDVRNPFTTISLDFSTWIERTSFSPDFRHILAIPGDAFAPIFLVNLESKDIRSIAASESFPYCNPEWINNDLFMLQSCVRSYKGMDLRQIRDGLFVFNDRSYSKWTSIHLRSVSDPLTNILTADNSYDPFKGDLKPGSLMNIFNYDNLEQLAPNRFRLGYNIIEVEWLKVKISPKITGKIDEQFENTVERTPIQIPPGYVRIYGTPFYAKYSRSNSRWTSLIDIRTYKTFTVPDMITLATDFSPDFKYVTWIDPDSPHLEWSMNLETLTKEQPY